MVAVQFINEHGPSFCHLTSSNSHYHGNGAQLLSSCNWVPLAYASHTQHHLHAQRDNGRKHIHTEAWLPRWIFHHEHDNFMYQGSHWVSQISIWRYHAKSPSLRRKSRYQEDGLRSRSNSNINQFHWVKRPVNISNLKKFKLWHPGADVRIYVCKQLRISFRFSTELLAKICKSFQNSLFYTKI